MSAQTMAEVERVAAESWDAIIDGAAPWSEQDDETKRLHTETTQAVLTAAGFGPVQDVAAAGIRSVIDVWASGGRATVRLSELSEIAKDVQAGEWENQIKWCLGDIDRERARASRKAES
ncbi:hypothetical protein [Pseudarthrobacter sp. PS3-L1]|uniref:hypothetical protein n=1 Tax=Pseudarthrobacter sp. PS3-L1 TaxID=3046207 RepID=UPI0024B8C2F6|nr:hypothetical protein [Pseudarthrobacter sp. PS3-L1]MDJ0322140.1 hypothetical protein [Pseudarthrobacter sp. PS3-L1]